MNEREHESCGAVRNEFGVERVAYRCRACGVSESRFPNQVSGQACFTSASSDHIFRIILCPLHVKSKMWSEGHINVS